MIFPLKSLFHENRLLGLEERDMVGHRIFYCFQLSHNDKDGYKDGMDGHLDGIDRVSWLVNVTVSQYLSNCGQCLCCG